MRSDHIPCCCWFIFATHPAQYVGMSLYNVVIMCVLGVAISAVLQEQRNASFVLISVFIIFCTTLTLCLVFVPKVNPLTGGRDNLHNKMYYCGGNEISLWQWPMIT